MQDASDLLELILGASGPSGALRQLDAVLAILREQSNKAASNAEQSDLALLIREVEAIRPCLLGTICTLAPIAVAPAAPLPSVRQHPSSTRFGQGGVGRGCFSPYPPVALRCLHFLGRGVSGRLADHRLDVERLAQAGLPILRSPADLADQLGLTLRRLRWLAFHRDVATRIHYIQFQVPKKSGGVRTLAKPHRQLGEVQRWIQEKILARLPVAPACHGFVPGRSIVSNAAQHARQGVVVNLDLIGFFPAVGFPRVRKVFERAGYSPAVSTVLGLLCTECPRRQVTFAGMPYWVATGPRGLPQGACTSPSLSNQAALRLDRRLTGLAGKLGLRYSRYADDLTFSGPAEFMARVGYLLSRVEKISLDEGFAIQEKKTRVLRRGTRQTVTGLVVNDRPGVVRREVRRLRAILHRARHEGLAAQNRDGRPNFRAWLLGKIAYVGMARPEVGAKLRAALDSLTTE